MERQKDWWNGENLCVCVWNYGREVFSSFQLNSGSESEAAALRHIGDPIEGNQRERVVAVAATDVAVGSAEPALFNL